VLRSATGSALLPTMLIMSAVVIMIGISGMAAGVALTRSHAAIRATNAAYAAARAGIADAVRRILRDTSWAPACADLANPSYVLSMGPGSVAVCAAKTGNTYAIQSLGSARGHKRRIDAVVSVDADTGRVRIESQNETVF
jgi:Tfp pilus assembly protein PilX